MKYYLDVLEDEGKEQIEVKDKKEAETKASLNLSPTARKYFHICRHEEKLACSRVLI